MDRHGPAGHLTAPVALRERLAIAVWLPDAPHPDRPVGGAAFGADRLAQLRPGEQVGFTWD